MKRALTLEEHLAVGLSRAEEVGDCLEWQGYMGNHGSQPCVKFRLDGRKHTSNIGVPKLIWEAANGPVPAGKLVYRACCNNACVLGDHIKVGTRMDWAKARKKAGTSKHSAATVLAITLSARKRAATVNSVERARLVRELLSAGLKRQEVAEKTGVSESMVADIGSNSSWRETGGFFSGLMR